MQNTEITEATTEELLEDLRFTENFINRKPLFPSQATAPRYLERKQEYREFRDQLLAELASRG